MDNNALSEQLQSVVKAIKFRRGDKNIKKMPHFKYCCEVIKRINERENEHEIQTRKSCRGLVKVSSLSNNRAMYSDPRLGWIMFHKISAMYRDLKHQETLQASLEIQNLKSL